MPKSFRTASDGEVIKSDIGEVKLNVDENANTRAWLADDDDEVVDAPVESDDEANEVDGDDGEENDGGEEVDTTAAILDALKALKSEIDDLKAGNKTSEPVVEPTVEGASDGKSDDILKKYNDTIKVLDAKQKEYETAAQKLNEANIKLMVLTYASELGYNADMALNTLSVVEKLNGVDPSDVDTVKNILKDELKAHSWLKSAKRSTSSTVSHSNRGGEVRTRPKNNIEAWIAG